LRRAADIDFHVKTILEKHHVISYIKVERTVREHHIFKQVRRGRPGPEAKYRKIIKRRFDIEWTIDQEAIAYDHKSDGMYPLITNDRGMSPAQVLEAHKGQPMIEKRFEQIKTVHEIAPVLLKNEGRIEVLFTLYFLALLAQAIIERELRLAMKREKIDELPLYPEQRDCARPTTEQILRLFSLAERHQLIRDGKVVEVFDVHFTDLQRQVLTLFGVSEDAFRLPR
jgi:transposase